MPMMMKIEMMKSTTKTAITNSGFREIDACWYDFNDKSTWFQDDALTVPALRQEDVRYVKNKVGPGYMNVGGVEKDDQGRHYVDGSGSGGGMHTSFSTNKPLSLNDLEAIEQRFMRDMGIFPK